MKEENRRAFERRQEEELGVMPERECEFVLCRCDALVAATSEYCFSCGRTLA